MTSRDCLPFPVQLTAGKRANPVHSTSKPHSPIPQPHRAASCPRHSHSPQCCEQGVSPSMPLSKPWKRLKATLCQGRSITWGGGTTHQKLHPTPRGEVTSGDILPPQLSRRQPAPNPPPRSILWRSERLSHIPSSHGCLRSPKSAGRQHISPSPSALWVEMLTPKEQATPHTAPLRITEQLQSQCHTWGNSRAGRGASAPPATPHSSIYCIPQSSQQTCSAMEPRLKLRRQLGEQHHAGCLGALWLELRAHPIWPRGRLPSTGDVFSLLQTLCTPP